MTAIFHITGGLGKHILSTAVINSYKVAHPDDEIITCSSYPAVFDGNESVTESLQLGNTQYFYKNYIKDKDVKIFAQEPYKQSSHITKKFHLIDTWCDMIGVENVCDPSLHLNHRITETITNQLASLTNKPILIFQPFGGNVANMAYCWARDIHPILAQQIVDKLKEKYNILHICNSYHPVLNNCIRVDQRLHLQELVNIINLSDRRILIDSSLQHIANVLNKKSLVVWNVTTPDVFGYKLHNNIESKFNYENGHRGSYLFNYEIGGIVTESPVTNYEEMFDIDLIFSTIENNF